ncbi:YceI family protein [Salinimicrobium tongyeongense]|uniref:YceI family protein n=1 Tax=Salinimicrobium tongyeongense TaxID=2809707 RepID=A0ABY6NMN4_9FLAO|nr:YceI family protein [Salinimicrobium tongyeongense]UZH54113.1 YceI family protein [Salinimicrobium tongyeongense]
MKKIAFVLLVLFCSAVTCAQDFQKRKITVLPSSELTIIGDSNIAAFKCEFDNSYLEDSQNITYTQQGSKIVFTGAVLTLNNKGFDCGSKGINRDFHDLLQTDKHPKILLELTEVSMSSPTKAVAKVGITIAGKERFYELPVGIKNAVIAEFKGKLHLNIKDYGLEAPKKLFGMIVVKDEIDIEFNLQVKK